jgi:carbon-monoxide dehydrogenase large subunit
LSKITFELNGKSVTAEAESSSSLADMLRGELGAYSVHLGCEHGVCGACTVLVEGKSVRSCLMLAPQAEGRRITTAEGVPEAQQELWGTIESSFVDEGAFQCGYCTSGMVVCLSEMLERGERLGRGEIIEQLSGQICRCTGYLAILSAFERVLEEAHLLVGKEQQ